MRNVITYASSCSTFATFSGKAARQQYCEGATEMAALREAEMRTEYLDFQFQPLRIEWLQPDGKWRRYTFDCASEMENGELVFEEFKADAAQFERGTTEAKLQAAKKIMSNYGIKVRCRDASNLQHSSSHAAISSLWAWRRTTVEERHVERAREMIEARGGRVALGQLLEQIDDDAHVAFGVTAALTMRRTVRIEFDQGPLLDASVTIPPETVRGRLRSFLAKFEEEL